MHSSDENRVDCKRGTAGAVTVGIPFEMNKTMLYESGRIQQTGENS
jgi:hypothetical protein